MSRDQLDLFLRVLKGSPPGAVFNPWWEVDNENDVGGNAPGIRRKQLRAYLRERLGKSKLAIIGEALGYRGGHFTGIPMTSERLLLGNQKAAVAALCLPRRSCAKAGERRNLHGDGGHRPPLQIISRIKPRRTSKPETSLHGFSEPTATIVWGALLKLGLRPTEFVLWNAFPWHSFDRHRGLLSNRTPNKSEQAAGLSALRAFLELFRRDQIVALGKIAAAQLDQLGVDTHRVRHPASGGAKLFRQQIAKITKEVR